MSFSQEYNRVVSNVATSSSLKAETTRGFRKTPCSSFCKCRGRLCEAKNMNHIHFKLLNIYILNHKTDND